MTATDWRYLLRYWLTHDSALAAVVGDRVYPIDPPQSPTLPMIVYQVVSDPEVWYHHGSALVQLSAYATTYDAALNVRTLIRLAARDWAGSTPACRIEAIDVSGPGREDHDPVLGWYRQDQDARILHVNRG